MGRNLQRRLAAAIFALVAMLVAAGCDIHETADTERGKVLFTEKCGSCHVLTEAGTQGTIGPDLDAAFKQSRSAGMDADTIEGVVQRQIAFPQGPEMPADLVKGQEAEDVAAYVAQVAGVPGIKPDPVQQAAASDDPGAQVYASQGCGSCHALEAAGSTGAVGPDLDQVLKGQSAAQVLQSIVEPAAKLTSGFGNQMPADFGDKLSEKELDQLVEFLLASTKG